MADTSIDRLTLDIVVNNDNATRRINSVTKAIEKLNTAVSKSGNLDKVLGTLNNVSPTRASSGGGGSKSSGGINTKNLNIFSTLGKWNYYRNMARYYGKELYKMVQYAMDYVETQNLWQVANRNNLQMADEFIQKMNKAYGISEQTLMNYQAIFKNMLSALGGISEEISSGLSMQLTQMAVDFSSLYNVSIPSAMQKFQAILSGQVRPIRSVSGYDITENTIFDLYQKAGGEKSMRQLNQLEKRLLRISAVFDQMDKTGALGDMEKTIESASNQARIMNEQFKETMTWTGQIILMGMESAGVLKYINAMLITAKNIMKAIAVDLGYSDKNFLDNMVFSAEEASEAVDEIQGKLLSFDKFEALNSKDSNILGIDQTVLDLLEKVKYETQDFQMEAQKLAESWTSWWVDADTGGLTQDAQDLLDVLKSIGIVVSTIMGYRLITKIGSLAGKITGLTSAMSLLNFTLATGVVYSIIKAIEAFKEGNVVIGILSTTIGVGLVGALIALELRKRAVARATQYEAMAQTATNTTLKKYNLEMTKANTIIASQRANIALLGIGISALGLGIATYISNFDEMTKGWKIAIPIVSALAGAVTALAIGIHASTPAGWVKAVGIGAMVAGGVMAVSSAIPKYATGGFPEDGFFYANSGELVGQFSNGKTAVANNEQIVQGITQGVYTAMMAYNAQTRGQGGSGDVYLDGTKVGKVVAKSSHKEMVRTGLVSVNA